MSFFSYLKLRNWHGSHLLDKLFVFVNKLKKSTDSTIKCDVAIIHHDHIIKYTFDSRFLLVIWNNNRNVQKPKLYTHLNRLLIIIEPRHCHRWPAGWWTQVVRRGPWPTWWPSTAPRSWPYWRDWGRAGTPAPTAPAWRRLQRACWSTPPWPTSPACWRKTACWVRLYQPAFVCKGLKHGLDFGFN